ncbi:MAG: ComEC/Rec2 family competence protein, partial [Bacteroidia bacterium]
MKLNRRISFWQLNPIARIALAYFIGLQSYKMIGFVNIEVTFCLCLFLLSFACIIFYTTEASQLKRLRCGNIILLFTICLIAGLSNSISHGRQVENTFPKELLGVNVQLRLKVQDELNFSKAGVVKFNATITHFKYQNQWYVSNSKVKCNSKFVDSISNLGPGAILHSIGQVNLPAYTEPNALFDYRNWLLDNKYSGTLSLNKEWMLISDGSNQLGGLSVRLRNSIFAFIRNSEYPESDKELAGALLLGDKVNLDPELKSSFSKSGIIHLLAVSGLHVGLVHQGISMILLLIFFGKPNLFFKSFITIILLWLYAFLTGLSPSVCRAATMLSLASIALAIKSHNQPFNTLFAAALILMIVDTDISSDIGFLLSFMAVFGILSSATLMKNLSSLGSQPIKFLLMSLLISSAAQWATLPITLFTFGKFPTYFLLANLLAIPLASFISFSGFLSLLFQSIPYVGELLLSLCMLSIELLNYISNLIADLPSSVLIIENLSISYFIVLLTVVIS